MTQRIKDPLGILNLPHPPITHSKPILSHIFFLAITYLLATPHLNLRPPLLSPLVLPPLLPYLKGSTIDKSLGKAQGLLNGDGHAEPSSELLLLGLITLLLAKGMTPMPPTTTCLTLFDLSNKMKLNWASALLGSLLLLFISCLWWHPSLSTSQYPLY